MHTITSYSDLKFNLNYAIHMKTRRKMMIFSEFLLTLFSIFLGRNSKKATLKEILHFEKHSSLCNRFGKRTMFLVFAFFHSHCKFRISTSPLQPEILGKLISELLFFLRFFLNFPRPYILIEWTNSFFLENFWATAMW